MVETLRKLSAASRKRWRWNRLSPSQYCAWGQSVARIFARRRGKPSSARHSPCAQDVAVGEVVHVLRAVRGRQRRHLGAGRARRARRRRRQLIAGRAHARNERRVVCRAQPGVERSSGAPADGRRALPPVAVRIGELRQRHAAGGRAERARHAGCRGILRRIERIAAPARCAGGRRRGDGRRRGRPCRRGGSRGATAQFLEAVLGLFLHPPHLSFELLIAVLQLLDGAGELSDMRFETIDAHDRIGRARNLSDAILARRRWAVLALFEGAVGRRGGRQAIAAAEDTLEESGAGFLGRHRGGADQHRRDRHRRDSGCPDCANG